MIVVLAAAIVTTIAGCSNPVGPTLKDQAKLTWTIDTIANPTPQTSLDYIWGSSPDNIYVVGSSSNWTGEMYRYNGKVWKVVPLSHLEGGPIAGNFWLNGILGFGANDIWVIGSQVDSINQVTDRFVNSSLIIHWNGSNWQEYPVSGGTLIWIAGLSPDDIWAAGNDVIFHYNGSSWQKSPVPMPPEGMRFASVAEVAQNDVYAVGWINSVTADTGSYYLYHYDGTSWTITDSVIITPGYVSPVSFGEKLFAIGGHLYSSFSIGGVDELEDGKWVNVFQNANGLWLAGNSPDNIFGLGSFGYLYWYNGASWTSLNVGANSSIAFFDAWSDGSQTFITGDDDRKTYVFHGY